MVTLEMDQVVAELSSQYGEERVLKQLEALERHGAAVDDPELWLRTAVARGFRFTPIEAVERCACGSDRSVILSRFVFWNLLGVRRCEECGLVFVSPRLTQDAMAWVFNQRYFRRTDPEYWGERRVPVFKDITRLLRRFRCRTVLDVGAAYGHFVKWAQDHQLTASGCDISTTAVEWGRENLGVSLTLGRVHDLDFPPELFDCVVSLDTLYYVADPAADLRAIRRLLRPGGYVALRLRNNLRLLARAARERNKPIGRPVVPVPHLWGFTPESIAEVLARCGFETELLEAAAYSRTPLMPVYRIGLSANRALTRSPLSVPILTRSFNVVAVRSD